MTHPQEARLSDITWAEIPQGVMWGPYEYPLTQEMVDTWISAMGDDQPAYRGEHACPPPGFMSIYFLKAAIDAFNGMPRGMVLARQEFRYGKPPRVGEPVLAAITVSDKYVHRERFYYIVCDSEVTSKTGDFLAGSRVYWFLEQ